MSARDYLVDAVFCGVAERGSLRGTAGALRAELSSPNQPSDFPRSGAAFDQILRQVEPELLALGIAVRRYSANRTRLIELAEAPDPATVAAESADADERLRALASFVVARRRGRGDICPRCGRGYVVAGPTGWCSRCAGDRRVELNEAERRTRERKLRWWNAPGGGADQRAARQAARGGASDVG